MLFNYSTNWVFIDYEYSANSLLLSSIYCKFISSGFLSDKIVNIVSRETIAFKYYFINHFIF